MERAVRSDLSVLGRGRLVLTASKDQTARLLRWHLLPPEQRPIDPYGTTTQEQAADVIIRPNMNKYEAEHAYDLDRATRWFIWC